MPCGQKGGEGGRVYNVKYGQKGPLISEVRAYKVVGTLVSVLVGQLWKPLLIFPGKACNSASSPTPVAVVQKPHFKQLCPKFKPPA